MNELKFDINLTEEDVYQFQKRHIYKKTSPVAVNLISAVFAALILALMIYQSVYGEYIPFSLLLLVLIIPALFLIVYPLSIKRATKNIVRTSKLFGKTQSCEINGEGFKASSENGNSSIKWGDFYKAVETPESFLLYISKIQAYIIPKRLIGESEESIGFIRSCLSNVPVPKEKGSTLKKVVIGFVIYAILFFIILYVLTIYEG